MAFETLLGNHRLKQNLTESLARGHISHFYLISGPEGSGKHTLAKLLAAAILCGDSRGPCMHCGVCRRVMADNHPDVITVADPEHKTVPVKLVREYREDAFIRPNESDYKIYLFPQELGVEGQNALLKILEEPPAYGVFILLADNPEKLLVTVRSRCTELKLLPLDGDTLKRQLRREFPEAGSEDLEAAVLRSGGYLGQARSLLKEGAKTTPQTEGFARAMARRDSLELAQILAPMEKWKRDDLLQQLQSWQELCEGALTWRLSGNPVPALSRMLAESRGSGDLMNAIRHLEKARAYALRNVSPGAICGWLAWALRE